MRPELFVDTSGWVALTTSSDSRHDSARAFAEGPARDFRWVTTNWVIAETATFLGRRLNHATAVQFHRDAAASGKLTIHQVTDTEEERGWSIFNKYDDTAFSVVDCMSFAVMEHRGIAAAFAFDMHFRQYGFVELPDG